MERGLSFGSRGPQSDFARLCWRVRIQNNNHQRHATTQGVSHAAVKHPARFRGLRAPHALYCAHQPNSAVKPTPTSSACGCPPCFALRRGLPRALGPSMSEATVGWLVLSSIAVASALGWHLLPRSFLLATVLATATAVVLFQVAAYLYAGYLDPFFLVAVITSSVICLLITVTVGMLVRNIKGKNNAL